MIVSVPLVVAIVIVPVVGSFVVVRCWLGSVPVLAPPPVQVTTVPDLATVWLTDGTPATLVGANTSKAITENAMATPEQPCLVKRAPYRYGCESCPRGSCP